MWGRLLRAGGRGSAALEDASDLGKRYLVLSSASAFLVKSTGAAAAFGLQVALARLLGPEEYGLFAYASTWAILLAMIGPLGFDRAALRVIPENIANGAPGTVRHFAFVSALVTAGVSGGVVLVYSAVVYSMGCAGSGTCRALLWSVPLILGNAFAQLGSETLRAFRRIVFADLVNLILRPMILMVAIVALVAVLDRPPSAVDALALSAANSALTIAVFVGAILLMLPGPPKEETRTASAKAWLGIAIPLLFVSLSNVVLARTDVIMVGALLGNVEAGWYNAATRVAILAGFPLVAINAVLAPMIAQLHASGEQGRLQEMVRLAAYISLVAATSVAVAVALSASFVLGLFGDGFAAGVSSLRVLVVAQVISATAGPAGYVLAMTGRQSHLARIVAITALLNVVLNAILVNSVGAIGAALATAICISLSNLLMIADAVRSNGLNPSVFPIKVSAR